MPRLDADVLLFYGSLGIAAVAVVLFLVLMREKRPPAPPPSLPKGGERG